ncbi:MAG: hypothetical protein ACUVV5_00730 [Candidatus Aminicenantales bacterium]
MKGGHFGHGLAHSLFFISKTALFFLFTIFYGRHLVLSTGRGGREEEGGKKGGKEKRGRKAKREEERGGEKMFRSMKEGCLCYNYLV